LAECNRVEDGGDTVQVTVGSQTRAYLPNPPGTAALTIADDPPVVTVGPGALYLPAGRIGLLSVFRSGGDPSQPLTASLTIGADGLGDAPAEWGTEYTIAAPAGSGDNVTLSEGGGKVQFGANQTEVQLAVATTQGEVGPDRPEWTGFGLSVSAGGRAYVAGGDGPADVRIAPRPYAVKQTMTVTQGRVTALRELGFLGEPGVGNRRSIRP